MHTTLHPAAASLLLTFAMPGTAPDLVPVNTVQAFSTLPDHKSRPR